MNTLREAVIALLTIAIFGVLTTGCATNAVTGRSQLMLVSEETAVSKSTLAYSNMIDRYAKAGKLSEDQNLVARVKGITDRLVTEAVKYRPDAEKWNWHVNVIDDPQTVNAFCMAGGKMGIFTGLIDQLEATDDEIAQVMGHEIGHALSNHTAEKMSMQLAGQLVVVGATVAADQKNKKVAKDLSSLAALSLITLPNSREAENEADRIGIELAAKAGYSPKAAISLFEKMQRLARTKSKFDFFSTHPASEKRVEHMVVLQDQMTKIYSSAKQADGIKPVNWTKTAQNSAKPAGKSDTSVVSNAFNPDTARVPERLRELHQLRTDNVITEADFVSKKSELLNSY